jgi:nucleotide-binding universal stress UspA family protein
MSESSTADTYDICLLLEQPLSHVDAQQIVALHETWTDPVHYHVLMPMEDAAAHIEAALGTLSAGDVMAAMPLTIMEEDVEQARAEAVEMTERNCAHCVDTLAGLGASADAEVVAGDPVEQLTQAVARRGSAEVIIVTRAHLVAEMLHTDWSHQARRTLGVPVLHMLAHHDGH